ncbi:uncharacterized protein BJ212DRAFT_1487019 [Suillus subaureus]|uniref:KOW domain-containing protein n=1 Tax=Suillus subaureus TaxID=48587 RepID=A0A9P7DUM9_9AGAM|nr:uncharacterized protein BJ212DRAFT_1487019 [Suillus subaureus]KAG1803418.1 hypothetical protein BJ212DRAFT_1487019 [Suillus subaureus]
MSKRTACTSDDECSSKRNWWMAPSPLADQGAWCILEQFLTTDMTYPQMEETFSLYLGDQYIADNWKDARNVLFSGNATSQALPFNDHLNVLNRGRTPALVSNKRSNPYIVTEADKKEEDEEDEEDEEGSSVWLPTVTCLSGPSAKGRLAAAFDNIYDRIQENPPSSSEGRHACHCKATSSPWAIEGRMYLLHIQRNGTDYIAKHLQSQGFLITVSGWVAGQLYVVADSPRTITALLPSSHSFAIQEYVRISEEERQAVEHANSKLPNPGWVRIKYGKYKGDIGYIFNSDQSNGLVSILIALRDFPYPMPGGSAIRDILHDGKVVGCCYRGEQYYMGLLVKKFHRDHLEIVASPHTDDIKLHMQSAWDMPFVRKTLLAFSMQFLHTGDLVRIIAGEIRSKISTVVLTGHTSGSDLEHIFCVGDKIQVVAGPYLGLEGHIIQISDDMFHIYQAVSKEEVLVSRYYLDHCPLHHVFHLQLPVQQRFEPPPQSKSIQVGDHIEVLVGEHFKKCSIVEWFPMGSAMLWFQDMDPMLSGDDVGTSVGLLRIQVPVAVVQRTKLPDTLKYTQERGYDVRPGDVMSVAHGLEYQRKGVVQNIDFPNARLTFLSDSDHSLINVPIRFVIKPRSITPPPVQLLASSSTSAVSSLSSWASWTANPENPVHPCESSSITPSLLTLDPWTVNPRDTQDDIDTRADKLTDIGPLPWLMGKEYSSMLLLHHTVLKVAVGFMGGRLHKQFVFMACPDPFCGVNGPAPEDCIAVFCTSSNAGATLQHYHIPTKDLSPAPPRRKKQQVLVLEGDSCRHIFTVMKCNLKKNSVEVAISPTSSITLRFDQICLVEWAQSMM